VSVFAIYDTESGLIVSHFMGSQKNLKCNLRPGHAAIPGRYDPLCRKVNTQTLEIEHYVPPQPSLEHVWNAVTERWELDPRILEERQKAELIRARITRLETSQHRVMREMMLGEQGAARRLEQIESDIRALRAELPKRTG
jgi:hypothetical protein